MIDHLKFCATSPLYICAQDMAGDKFFEITHLVPSNIFYPVATASDEQR